MNQYRIRLRNKLRQLIYKPKGGKSKLMPPEISEALDNIDKEIEKTITPLLADFFKN